MTSYNKVRKISFAVFISASILFAFLLIYLGKQDIKRAEEFAEKERSYIDSLMRCSSSLDDTMQKLQIPFSKDSIHSFSVSFEKLRRNINLLSDYAGDKNIRDTIDKLKANASATASALDSSMKNFENKDIDSDEILYSDQSYIFRNLSEIGEGIHHLIAGEYELAALWQKQSLFFFRKLQYMLLIFFLLTTLFFVISSSYSAFLLKKYLNMLSQGTKEISSGNLKYRFSYIEPDEMGALMADFNSMASRLEQQTFELKKINKELEEKAQQLIEANMHKDRFFANMSHELRTPLSAIIGFSELNLSRKDYPVENMRENSRQILEAAEHLLSLISGLLDIAKADATALTPKFTSQDIAKSISSAAEMLKPLAERKKLSFEIEKLTSKEFIFDERMIRQILINIIGNAIKFTNQGGIKVRTNSDDSFYIIEVEDTGIGISEEDQKKIFTDFHRVENGLTSNYEGVGLGLALSKRLVKMHNGEINVQSKPGKGSIFTIKIRLTPDPKIKK